MTTSFNNGYGGVTGATVLATDVGGGTALDTVTGTWKYGTDDFSIGAQALVAGPLSAASAFLGYTTGFSSTVGDERLGYCYTVQNGAIMGVGGPRSSAGKIATLSVTPTTGALILQDSTVAHSLNLATVTVAGQLYFYDIQPLVFSTTVGQVAYTVWDHAGNVLETGTTPATWNTGTTPCDGWYFGTVAAVSYTGQIKIYQPGAHDSATALTYPPTVLVPAQTIVPKQPLILGATASLTPSATGTVSWAADSGSPPLLSMTSIAAGINPIVAGVANPGGGTVAQGAATASSTIGYTATLTQSDNQSAKGHGTITIAPATDYVANADGTFHPLEPSYGFGALPNACILSTQLTNAADAAALYALGYRGFMLEIKWNLAEGTTQGTFDDSYLNSNLAQIAAYHALGPDAVVILSLGAQYQPGWLPALGGQLAQDGSTSTGRADLVYFETVAAALDVYINHLGTLGYFTPGTGLNANDRVRDGGVAAAGEMMYETSGANYLMGSAPARSATGVGLNAYLSPNPFPTFTPGTGAANGGVTSANIDTWVQWYIDSLVLEHKRIADRLTANGFGGPLMLLWPGVGAQALGGQGVVADEAAFLPLGANHLLTIGAAWYRVAESWMRLAGATYGGRTEFYCTSTGDFSGTPSDNTYTPSDLLNYTPTTIPVTGGMIFGASHVVAFLANWYGVLCGGENPGFGGTTSFQYHFQDGRDAQGLPAKMALIAETAGFADLSFAHDSDNSNGHQDPGFLRRQNIYQRCGTLVPSPPAPMTYDPSATLTGPNGSYSKVPLAAPSNTAYASQVVTMGTTAGFTDPTITYTGYLFGRVQIAASSTATWQFQSCTAQGIVGENLTGDVFCWSNDGNTSAKMVLTDCAAIVQSGAENLYLNAIGGHDITDTRGYYWGGCDGFDVRNSHNSGGAVNVKCYASWFGGLSGFLVDPEHSNGPSHNDPVQIFGGSGIDFYGCHFDGFVTTTRGDGANWAGNTPFSSNGGLQGNSAVQTNVITGSISNVGFHGCYYHGGNITVNFYNADSGPYQNTAMQFSELSGTFGKDMNSADSIITKGSGETTITKLGPNLYTDGTAVVVHYN
jgi:hypothetical protein